MLPLQTPEKTDGSDRSCLRRSRDRSKYHSVADTSEEKRKKRMKQIKKIGLWCILLFACIQISGCGDGQTSWKSGDHEISSELNYEKSMDLDYATEFAVDYYENGFTLISISDGSRFLLNTEGEQVPEDLEKGITVLNAPVSNIYLVASAAMDMFCSIGALDHICLSGLPEENGRSRRQRRQWRADRLYMPESIMHLIMN